jgi:SAM-dependent methyltransferase
VDAALYTRIFAIEDWYWWSVGTRAIFCDWLAAALHGQRGRLLDVGCGTGALSRELTVMGSVTAVDRSVEAVTLSRERGLKHLCVASAEVLPFKSAAFDAVAAVDLIEHTDDRSALREIARVVKPGGVILIHVPAFPILWGEHDEIAHHRRRYRRLGLVAALQSSGLRVERLSYVNFLLFPAAVCVRLAKRVLRVLRGKKPPQAEIYNLPAWANTTLTGLLGCERRLLRWTNLPFGVSLVCIARKGDDGGRS